MRQRGIDALFFTVCRPRCNLEGGPCFKIQSENQGKGTHSSTRPTENTRPSWPENVALSTWPEAEELLLRSPCLPHSPSFSETGDNAEAHVYSFPQNKSAIGITSVPQKNRTLLPTLRGEGVGGCPCGTGDTQQDNTGLALSSGVSPPCRVTRPERLRREVPRATAKIQTPPSRGQSHAGHCCLLRSWRTSGSCLATLPPPRFPRSVPARRGGVTGPCVLGAPLLSVCGLRVDVAVDFLWADT